LIAEYQNKPTEFLAQFGKKFPPKLKAAFLDIYSGRVTRALLRACRGGGKSQLLSALSSAMYLFRRFDVLMLGGSAAQSKADYNYTSEILTDNPVIESFSEDILATVTTSKLGHWLKCLAASGTSVRGPHAGDPHKEMNYEPHGGMLVVDEECEAAQEIVEGALPTVNAADPDVIVRGSTAHKAVGTFADLCDHAEEMGYVEYHWDCFDICRACRDDCSKCFVEFAGALHPEWEEFQKTNPEFKPYCEGRAKDGEGWMRIEAIKQFFREYNRERFEVEMLGWRPSGEGLVLKPDDVKACIVEDMAFMPGMPGCITIDWGLIGTCAVEALQEQKDHIIAFLESDTYHMAPDQVIYDRCVQLRELYGFNEVYADGSHPYQNFNLQGNYGFQVTPVPFNQYKDLGAGWLKGLTEKRRLRIPKRFEKLIEQLKGWRKREGKIIKKNDHHPDSTLCAALKWAEHIPVVIEGQGSGVQREYTKAGRF